ncbi:hypothetical protein O3G_MSEX006140 [Manduca sexta]|uniref:Uncharacterized protein n=1 Tax=Manduca sexta TaxID=7130 RepID=A0A922CKI8_MANSE|nr:hypothetical protein O3G_MSEX006140 [Manduca sexta]KAG6449618.1 hypothetical protein O3G_MSEX006140 [Manduca sexta]
MELNLTKSFIIALKLLWSPYFSFWDKFTKKFLKSSQETVVILLQQPLLTTVLSSLLILMLLGILFISFAAIIITLGLIIIILIVEGSFMVIGFVLTGLILIAIFIFFIMVNAIKHHIEHIRTTLLYQHK